MFLLLFWFLEQFHQFCESIGFPTPILEGSSFNSQARRAQISMLNAYFSLGFDLIQQSCTFSKSISIDLFYTVIVYLILQFDHYIIKQLMQMNEKVSIQYVINRFMETLQINRLKAEQKKQEYLERIMQIFRQFVSKSQRQIDRIINKKLQKLQQNYYKIIEYLDNQVKIDYQQKNIIITQYLIKPFEKFPFSGNKNQKIFKQQYSLIEKASLLIQQTLVDSFNQEQIPNFKNTKFFQTVQNYGIGQQSLFKLNISPQNLGLTLIEELIPSQKNIHSLKMMGQHLILVGDDMYLQIWDLQYKVIIKKIYLDVIAPVTALSHLKFNDLNYLAVGFGDQSPQITIYRTDNWKKHGCNLVHTRSITKIVQFYDLIFSGSTDGNICVYSFQPFKNLHSCPHISSIQDLICKNNMIYVLLKCSSLCEYEIQFNDGEVILHFRRTLSTGFISMIRYTQVGGNFSGVACHIYGLSQIEITRKFRVQQSNIINVSQMIADFVVLESKNNSDYYAICGFQNSSAIRIYSLKSGEAIYQLSSDYLGQVGVAGYMPKVQIAWVNQHYEIMVVNQSEFESGNTVRIYHLQI